MLIHVSMGYTPVSGRLHTRYSPVRRSPSRYCYLMMPLDLHVLSLSLAFILSQDQTLHSNKTLKIISFAQSLYPLNLFSDSHLLFVFKPFNIFKNSFCFSFTRPTYEAKADAKINTFTYSLQIFPHFFSNFFRNRRRRKLLQASSAKDEKHISQNVSERPLRFGKRLQR